MRGPQYNHWLPIRNSRGKLCDDIFKEMKGKKCRPRIPSLEIRIFPDKQRPGKFTNSCPTYDNYWRRMHKLKKKKKLESKIWKCWIGLLQDLCVSAQNVPNFLLISETKGCCWKLTKKLLWRFYSFNLFYTLYHCKFWVIIDLIFKPL